MYQDEDKSIFVSGLAAVLIPLVQSAISGLLLAVLIFSLAIHYGYERPWLAFGVTWGLVATIAWGVSLDHWRATVYGGSHPKETPVSGIVYKASMPKNMVRVELYQDDGRQVTIGDLPANQEQLRSLAGGLLSGQSLSEASWTGRGRPFSRRQFRALRDVLLRRSWVRWIDPTARAQGLELSPAGWAVMRHLADLSPTPEL